MLRWMTTLVVLGIPFAGVTQQLTGRTSRRSWSAPTGFSRRPRRAMRLAVRRAPWKRSSTPASSLRKRAVRLPGATITGPPVTCASASVCVCNKLRFV